MSNGVAQVFGFLGGVLILAGIAVYLSNKGTGQQTTSTIFSGLNSLVQTAISPVTGSASGASVLGGGSLQNLGI